MRKAGLLLLLGTVALHGQIPYQKSSTPWPKSPTTNDDITFVVLMEAGCPWEVTSSINGYDIRINVDSNARGCVSMLTNVDAPLGHLPAGTYTVRVVVRGNEAEPRIFTFAVTDGTSIPTLDPAMLSVLLVVLAGIGVVATRSMSA